MTRRRVTAYAVVLLAAGGLAGCTPSHDGRVGIGIDDQGELLLVAAACGDGIEKLELAQKPQQTSASEPPLASFPFPVEGNGQAERPLRELIPADAYEKLAAMGPQTFTITGWTGVNIGRIETTQFRGVDLAGLAPDLVVWSPEGPGDAADPLMSRAEFNAPDCPAE